MVRKVCLKSKVRIEKQIRSLVFWEKLRLDNFVSRPLVWINDWDNSLIEQMDRTCEEIMTTSSGTGNGKRICDEK